MVKHMLIYSKKLKERRKEDEYVRMKGMKGKVQK